MQKSIATKTAPRHFGQRLKALLGQTSFVVTLCATLALVLGAISVGATSYLTRQLTQPVATPISAPADGSQATTSDFNQPATQQPSEASEPTSNISAPTIAQPADTYVPDKPVHGKPALVSINRNTDEARLKVTLQLPEVTAADPLIITIPNEGGISVISDLTKLIPHLQN